MGHLFKVIIAGDGGVGKSTILKRLLTSDYIPQKLTVGVNHSVFETKIDNDTIKLVIWDLGGQKQFRTIHDIYCMGAKGIIFVYDLSRKDTLFGLYFWHKYIEKRILMENKKVVKILVGNKADVINYVPAELTEELKKDFKINYDFIVSAKDNLNILSTFQTFTNLLYEKFVER